MTLDEYKVWVVSQEGAFAAWCHKKWVVMPTGIYAVLAWRDFEREVLKNGAIKKGAVGLCEKFGMGWCEATYLIDYLFIYLESRGVNIEVKD